MISTFLRDNARWLSAGILLTFFSSFGQTFFIAVYSEEIRTDFGLSHSAWGSLYAFATTASAIVMIWAGALTDVFRVRLLGPLALVTLAVACLSMTLAQSIWALIATIFLLRLAGQGMMSHVASVAMARWFVKTRGKALSISALGFAFGQAVLPVVFVALLALFTWRVHWSIAAILCLIAIPILLTLLRTERTPQAISKGEQSVGMKALHWTRKSALQHSLFWFLVPSLLGPAAFITAFFFQQAPIAEEKGWTHLELVALFPMYTVISIAAMLGSGVLIDRYGTSPLVPLYQVPLAVSFAILAMANSLWIAAVGIALMAASAGAIATIPSAFWAEYYGTRYIGGIKAIAAAIAVLGSAIGPGLTGFLLDQSISLDHQMIGFAAYFLLASGTAYIGIQRNQRFLSVTP